MKVTSSQVPEGRSQQRTLSATEDLLMSTVCASPHAVRRSRIVDGTRCDSRMVAVAIHRSPVESNASPIARTPGGALTDICEVVPFVTALQPATANVGANFSDLRSTSWAAQCLGGRTVGTSVNLERGSAVDVTDVKPLSSPPELASC